MREQQEICRRGLLDICDKHSLIYDESHIINPKKVSDYVEVSIYKELMSHKEIECFHPSSVDEDKKDILVGYARKNNLYISGGSDYHGRRKPDIEIGIGRGNLNISKEIIEEWI